MTPAGRLVQILLEEKTAAIAKERDGYRRSSLFWVHEYLSAQREIDFLRLVVRGLEGSRKIPFRLPEDTWSESKGEDP